MGKTGRVAVSFRAGSRARSFDRPVPAWVTWVLLACVPAGALAVLAAAGWLIAQAA